MKEKERMGEGMAANTTRKAADEKKPRNKQASHLQRPVLLFTIVSRSKAEFYVDLLQSFEANIQLIMAAKGTAKTETLQMLGLADTEKAVIVSVIQQQQATAALSALNEKFYTIKNGKGIAYTVPVSGSIGVAVYQFLMNKRDN